MNESIDESVCINIRKEPLVNSARLAQGDMEVIVINGVMTSAKVSDNTIAQKLITMGIIEEEHREAGVDMLEIKLAFYGALKSKSALSLFLRTGSCSLSREKVEALYCKVKKQLPYYEERIIEHTLNPSHNWKNDAAIKTSMGIQAYRLTYERLLRIMEDCIIELKKEIENV